MKPERCAWMYGSLRCKLDDGHAADHERESEEELLTRVFGSAEEYDRSEVEVA